MTFGVTFGVTFHVNPKGLFCEEMEVKSKLFKRTTGKSKGTWVIRIEYFDQLVGKKKFMERHALRRSDAGDERDRLVTFNSLADICEKGFYKPAVPHVRRGVS